MSSATSGYYEAEYLFWDVKALNVRFQNNLNSLVLTEHFKIPIANSLKQTVDKKTMEIRNKQTHVPLRAV